MSQAQGGARRARPVLRVLGALFEGRTWREYAHVLFGSLVAAPAFLLGVLGVIFSALSLFTVGLPFLAGVLTLARHGVRWFRGPSRLLLGWTWPDPPPVPLLRVVTDATSWRALAYCLLAFPVRIVPAYLGTWALVAGPVFLTGPVWWHLFPAYAEEDVSGAWLLAAESAAVLLLLPWFLRFLVALDRLLAYALLAPTADSLRVAELKRGRAALRADSAALLRRVERDLHDGTQARLVALGVTLSRIERRAGEPEVRELAADARAAVTGALAELRDIVRGMHPPVLDDGLEVALTSLAGRSAVPVRVRVDLPRRPPDATASAIYFTVAELLTNVARHAGADRAVVELTERDGCWHLEVGDDGRGGAEATVRRDSSRYPEQSHRPDGTGLAGLRRRAEALDGTLTVRSPPGGPTVVTMILPRED